MGDTGTRQVTSVGTPGAPPEHPTRGGSPRAPRAAPSPAGSPGGPGEPPPRRAGPAHRAAPPRSAGTGAGSAAARGRGPRAAARAAVGRAGPAPPAAPWRGSGAVRGRGPPSPAPPPRRAGGGHGGHGPPSRRSGAAAMFRGPRWGGVSVLSPRQRRPLVRFVPSVSRVLVSVLARVSAGTLSAVSPVSVLTPCQPSHPAAMYPTHRVPPLSAVCPSTGLFHWQSWHFCHWCPPASHNPMTSDDP